MKVAQRFGEGKFLILAFFAFMVLQEPVFAKTVSRRQSNFCKALYQELHPGESPRWSEFGGFHGWARKEKERLEPIVLEILRGEREEVPWEYAVSFVAQDIPTTAICDAIHDRMERILTKEQTDAEGLTLRDRGLLVQLLLVLAEGDDKRAVEPLNALIGWSKCSHALGYDYLMALRKVGDGTSLKALRRMPLRETNRETNLEAALTEKIIEARLNGVSISPNAQKELSELGRRFVRAAETQDYKSYISCFPIGFEEIFDEQNMAEFLEHPDGRPGLEALAIALDNGESFDVDLEELRAKLICDEAFLFECVLEVDGWKVMNISPLPPVQLRNDVLPQSSAKKKSAKRIFIGIPAKDGERP